MCLEQVNGRCARRSGLSGQAFADFARKEGETLLPIVEKANIKLN
jgi:hypothetical protein